MGAALECKGAMQYEAKETHLIHTKTSPDRLSMPLEDIDTICPGCKTPFSTGRGLMSHIRQTSNTDCRRVFNEYVQLALQLQDPDFSLEDDFPSSPISMEDLEVLDEHLPHLEVEAEMVDYDMTLDEEREHLPDIDSGGNEIEAEFQVEIEDQDIEVASAASTDDEDEGGGYLW